MLGKKFRPTLFAALIAAVVVGSAAAATLPFDPTRPAREVFRYDFNFPTVGGTPTSGLIADSRGSLYGTLINGSLGGGLIYKLVRTRSGYSETGLYGYSNSVPNPYGSEPYGAPVLDRSGNLYGTTYSGGIAEGGIAYKLSPSTSGYNESILFYFGVSPLDGAGPTSRLVLEGTGALYGTTDLGGIRNGGTVFKLTPTPSGYVETVLHAFGSGTDGRLPRGDLILDRNGALYGTTVSGGGRANAGTVFKLTATASGYLETVLYRFGARRHDGTGPYAGLLMDRGGALYGTTTAGGRSNAGTVFKLVPATLGYSENILYNFSGGSDGAFPSAALVADRHGFLYGTTTYGGAGAAPCCAAGNGTAFVLLRTAMGYREIVLYRFNTKDDGVNPQSSLLLDDRGNMFGTTYFGGTYAAGTAFELHLNTCW